MKLILIIPLMFREIRNNWNKDCVWLKMQCVALIRILLEEEK